MSGSIDDLKKAALQASEDQEKFAEQCRGIAEELKKDAVSIANALGSHKTSDNVVNAIQKASQAVESAAETCKKSATATRDYVAQQFGGQ